MFSSGHLWADDDDDDTHDCVGNVLKTITFKETNLDKRLSRFKYIFL